MGSLYNEWVGEKMAEQGQRIRELEAQLHPGLPFAYVGIVRLETCGECGQGERYLVVRPTLREVVGDPVLRRRGNWPDDERIEIMAVYRNGRQETLPINCYADPPLGRATHWRWRDRPLIIGW